MRPVYNEWTIVVLGHWNPHIFSPPWLSRQILNVEALRTEFAIGPGVANVRYVTENLVVMPRADRVIVGVTAGTPEVLQEAERVTRRILDLLTHTPVAAIGVNFAYIEDDPPDDILRTFQLADTAILNDNGYVVAGTDITRQITQARGTLRLKMTSAEGTEIPYELPSSSRNSGGSSNRLRWKSSRS